MQHQDKARHRRKSLLWPEEFERLRQIQKSARNTAPRWDLGDLTSAAVALVLQQPNALEQLRAQAARSLSNRLAVDPVSP